MTSQRLGILRLYRNLDKILVLFFMVFMFMESVWVPVNSFAAEGLLRQTGYLFFSYNNAVRVLTSNWLVTLGFVSLFAANLFTAYFQIGLIFLGLRNLLDKQERSVFQFLGKTLRDSWSLIRYARPGKVVFIALYTGFLFPFLRQILKIYYLNKLLIPEFIVTYLKTEVWMKWLIYGLIFLLFVAAVRLMFALPKLFFEHAGLRDALRYSLGKTKKRVMYYTWKLAWLLIKSFLLFTLISLPILLLQQYMDSQSNSIAFASALVNYVLIKLAYYIMLAYFLIKFAAFLTDSSLSEYRHRKGLPLMRWFVLLTTGAIFAVEGFFYINFPLETIPVTISHRGVSQANGVQNTVESLEKTALLKPDYIEMDVQETADGQFVMMHDANLQALAGVNARPQELTLEELTSLDISENGHTAKISSFDAYLKRANQLGQRLLIEIKTSKLDSADMMDRFLKLYAANIKIYGHQIQSLDYRVIDKTVTYDAAIPTFFILPYNTIFPRTKASGYTMEYSTLDENFVNKLWTTDKLLYDWTINDEDSIAKSFRLGVDGMITDNLELVQTSIKELQNNPKYTVLLMNKAADLLNFS
ncbi:glycerophosphoryl diester phosphodiesterase membrane domain-containing protein [Streptococcus panodentis]|uniref:Glycerophosphodiester phosphodiesterase n=1 Tax=Streptococcus panodentis TaxID=1581472 RepID=A0ABS5AVM0_9STRE|nr:glycerophosphodiester phosphodiesterase [Streptococcus panodentis]MBP2620624.1 glycerophosphodiester phosphodiesterase [Streptococcus panodentis]